jgi:NADH/F420H2 dehydrogenase subunit C
MNTSEIAQELSKNLPQEAVALEGNALIVKREHLIDVAKQLKQDPWNMDHVTCVTGVDYVQYLECVYHFASMQKKSELLVLKVRVSYEDPVIPSLTPLFRGCEYQEREAYDMIGLKFQNHPDLRRILMWDEFEAFPMRKSYTEEDQDA